MLMLSGDEFDPAGAAAIEARTAAAEAQGPGFWSQYGGAITDAFNTVLKTGANVYTTIEHDRSQMDALRAQQAAAAQLQMKSLFTGSSSNTGLWLALGAVMLVGVVLVARRR